MIQYIRLKQKKLTGNMTRLYLSMSDGLNPQILFGLRQVRNRKTPKKREVTRQPRAVALRPTTAGRLARPFTRPVARRPTAIEPEVPVKWLVTTPFDETIVVIVAVA
jgi:hypothetical protein